MANITGTSGNDPLNGTSSADNIDGLGGDDTLAGGLGNDTLNGGAGFDAVDYFEATGAVTVNLANGTASGADGNDVLINIEDVWGSNFSDTLTGDANDNFLRGQQGNDTLNGGAGFDAADYFEATGAVRVNLANGTVSGADGNDVLINIEDVWGSNFSDTLTGDANDNFLFGDQGDDTLAGDQGDDTLNGGAGYDAADYFEATGAVTVNLASGTVSGADGNDVLVSIEDVFGSAFNDTLTGDANDNVLFGDLGNDTLNGGGGIDWALFTGNRAGYTVANTVSGYTVSGAGGTDTLASVERAQFSDKGLAFDLGLNEAAGNTVRIIGAAFDAPTIQQHPDYVGIGLDLFDGGWTMPQVCELVIQVMGLSNTAFVTTVYTNVVGVAPSSQDRDYFVGLLQGSGGTMTQAQLLEIAANVDINAQNIDLVGLQQSGVEFV